MPDDLRELTALSDPTSPLFELVEERPGLSLGEAYALLAGAGPQTSSVPKIVVAAAEVHTGAMVALVPSNADAKRLRMKDGEPIDQLHTTLAYLGDADDISNKTRKTLVARLRALVVDAPIKIIKAEGFGLSVFNPPGVERDDGKDRDTCLVLQLSGDELARVHTLVSNVVGRLDGLKLPEQPKPWIPHVTLTYVDELDAAQLVNAARRAGPVTFDRLRLAFAGDVVDVPLVS